MLRLLNVATPLEAVTGVVPVRGPNPGLFPIAIETEVVLSFVLRLSFASSTETVTAGVIDKPATVLLGCSAISLHDALPILISNPLLVAVSKPDEATRV